MNNKSNPSNIIMLPLLFVMGPAVMWPIAMNAETSQIIRLLAWTFMGCPWGAAAVTTAYLIRDYLHGFTAIRGEDGRISLPWGVFDYLLMLFLPTLCLMFTLSIAGESVPEPFLACICSLGGVYGMIVVINIILRKAMMDNEKHGYNENCPSSH